MAYALAPVRGDTRHFFLVDLVRGLAALTVVIFHYQNFAIPAGSTEQLLSLRAEMPLRPLLWPVYDYGVFAVQLFWLISGFVFTGVYVGHGHSTRHFVVSRIARLYPLHLITLLVVAGLQFGRMAALGNFAIYQDNDAYHFVLHLFMASDWGFQRGPSFNAPIWSVSLEILIYAMFWLTAPRLYRFGIIGPAMLAGVFACGSVFNLPGTLFWQCGFYFFVGSVVHLAYVMLGKRAGWLAVVGAIGIIAVSVMLSEMPSLAPVRVMPAILLGIFLSICGIEAMGLKLPRRIRAIGDMTYGVYLWHIALVLTATLVMDGMLGSRRLILEPWFLIAYIVSIVAVGWLSFRFIEKPLRNAVRRRFDDVRLD